MINAIATKICKTAVIGAIALPSIVTCQVTEIIDSTGDGMGNTLSAPVGIGVDSSGTVYVSGFASNNLFSISPTGTITEFPNLLVFGAGYMVIDTVGTVYLTVSYGNGVLRIPAMGPATSILTAAGDGAGNTLRLPTGILLDASGNIFVAGQNSDNVFRISPLGVVSLVLDASGDGAGNLLEGPVDLAIDAAGNLYVACQASNNVFRVTPAGSVTVVLDAAGAGPGQELLNPTQVVLDSVGNLYASGANSNNVFQITPSGTVTEIVNGDGAGPGRELNRPAGLAVDPAGNLFVTGSNSNNVLRVDPTGFVEEVLNSSGDGAGNTLAGPLQIVIDETGTLYVVCGGSDNAFRVQGPVGFPEICMGDGGNQMGCTHCPCGNNAPAGTYGGCINSTGGAARLFASGDPSVSLPNGSMDDLRFALSGAPADGFAILSSGDAAAPNNMANPCFGLNSGVTFVGFDGLRCVVGNTRRHGTRSIDADGEVGVNNNPWGGEGAPLSGIAQAGMSFAAGQTRYFQIVYRDDVMLSCETGLNSSQAVEVLFAP